MARPSIDDTTLAGRLAAVLEHLGVHRAHLVAQMPGDISGFVNLHRGFVDRLVLVAPPRIEPEVFAGLEEDLLFIAPQGGMLARTAAAALPRLTRALHITFEGYDAESWSDIAKDRPDLADLITAHCYSAIDIASLHGDEAVGEFAGIRYRVFGNGPPLVLTPMAFAPSQWEPILPLLAEHFRVIALSGVQFGMLALLEQRGALHDWRAMCSGIFAALDLSPGDRVLEVGCGSGPISKRFVHETQGRNPLTAIDISAYFLNEARLSAADNNVAGIDFIEASAEDLPFADDVFDAAYTVTVLEECNAARATAELVRVVKPGGRVGIAVRAIDMPQWWNMPLDQSIRAKIEMPAASVGPGGVADASLYKIAAEAGLMPLRQYTFSVASESHAGPVFEFPEMHALSQLTGDEQSKFRNAKAQAIADGTLFMTRMHHCFVGEVPG